MAKVLVTGGAGYIGSHMVLKLLEAGHQPVVVDDLSTGIQSFVPKEVPLHAFSISDADKLSQLLQAEQFDIVMHFAAFIEVGESVKKPEKYYHNNFINTLTLLNVMKQHKVKHFIFSSTAAIFGEPHYTPADEKHPKQPLNPYGASKLMCEQLLQDMDIAYGLKSVCLRYFNAAGADPAGRTGYRTANASHLIPIALQTILGQRPHLEVYGRDYPTPDGTCIRDYIHVMDLCEAHLLAMHHLLAGGESRQYNVGNGQGYSVQQVIDTVKQVTGQAIKVVDSGRRAGDPAQLVADSRRIQQELNWRPHYPLLADIIEHAWKWENICCRADQG
ncbi:MAG: UDP-glucose 4-epimerase GalE [Gammaproteobacteria bacterium]|nr:MAG: UDP-glucose 4-epimerase GalE [Gammaproteobacteria bacterium]